MKIKTFRLFLISIGMLCLVASRLFASPAETYGMSSRASATAGLIGTVDADPAFTYQNPSLLPQAEKPQAHFGFLTAIDLFKPVEGVVTKGSNSGDFITDYPNLTGISYGLIFPMRTVRPKVAFGVAGFLPFGSLADINTLSNGDAVYLNYFTDPKRFSMIMGGAVAPFENFSIGAAANIYLTSGAYTKLDLNNKNSDVIVAMDIRPAISPIVGMSYAWKNWGLHAAYHGEVDYAMTLKTESDVQIGEARGESVSIPVQFIAKTSTFFDPQKVTVGISHAIRGWIQVGLQASWKNWKRYQIPINKLTYINVSDYQSNLPDIKFKDVVSPSVGVEMPIRSWRLRAGYRYEPRHIEFQEENSNIIDTDVHVISTGLGYKFKSLFGFIQNPFHLDLHFQLHQLKTMAIEKTDPSAVGYKQGGYDVGGSLFNYGLTFGTSF